MEKVFLGKINIVKKDFLSEIKPRSFYIPVYNLKKINKNAFDVICEIEVNDETFTAVYQDSIGQMIVCFDIYHTLDLILNEKLFKPKKLLYSQLPFHYHRIPFRAMKLIFLILYGKKGILKGEPDKEFFPNWPIDYSVYFLMKLSCMSRTKQLDQIQKVNLSKGKKYALCLTHDVDTSDGFNKITEFVEIEQDLGFVSTFFLPAFHYDIDFKLLKLIEGFGFEIGIHGYNHDGRLPFTNLQEIDRKLKKSIDKFREHVKVFGYRSPSFLRTPNLYKILEKYFLYDSSAPDTLNLSFKTSFDGCGSVFPYQRGNILEIPVTISNDADLLIYGYNPEQILRIWREKINFIRNIGGTATVLTHTDPHFSGNKKMLELYRKFLKEIKSDNTCYVTLCKDLIKES